MNNMDSETKVIHLRLELWGRETRNRLNGWPETTLLGRLIEQGPMGAPQAGRPPTDLSEPSARVDGCVAKLPQIDQRVLRTYYQRQLSREDLGRVCGMRERQAQNVLRRARWRVMAHLAVVEG
jgi:DNA-directed RNA polymerase specialized sigma24 family protein